jgi:hypothetical protein
MDCNDIDSEILDISDFKKNSKNGDLFHVGGKLYDDLKIKIASILFILFIILNSDIFVEGVLSKFINGTYDASCDKITEKGIVISAMILSLSYIFIDFLFEKKIV